MRWPYPILTDSGGFQVMSLANLRKVDADGVSFRSHIDGSEHRLTPERSIEIQRLLDSDIVMQLDECIALPATAEEMERAMRLSLAWAERSKAAFGTADGKALFGIVQGGDVPALRLQSAEGLVAIGFDGYAVGGLAVGEPQATMLNILDETVPALPQDRPRYLMGVGTPDDILESVARGVDMFDCVMPTRAGRHGLAYTRFGKLNMKNARHADDKAPIDEESDCPAARDYSRAYIHHLVKAGEALGAMLLTWNNLAYYQSMMAEARAAIAAGALRRLPGHDERGLGQERDHRRELAHRDLVGKRLHVTAHELPVARVVEPEAHRRAIGMSLCVGQGDLDEWRVALLPEAAEGYGRRLRESWKRVDERLVDGRLGAESVLILFGGEHPDSLGIVLRHAFDEALHRSRDGLPARGRCRRVHKFDDARAIDADRRVHAEGEGCRGRGEKGDDGQRANALLPSGSC